MSILTGISGNNSLIGGLAGDKMYDLGGNNRLDDASGADNDIMPGAPADAIVGCALASGSAGFQYIVSDEHGGQSAGAVNVNVPVGPPALPGRTSLTASPETGLPAGLGGSRIAALSGDRYAVVYQDTDAIAVQVLNANGQPLGLPLAISGAGPHPWAPSITGLRDGGFVITWTNDTTSTAIDTLAQRFDANGVAQGGIVRVNSYLPDGQGGSVVSALDDGGYVIAWHSFNQDGSSFGVYGQRYDAVGQPAGGEFRINQTTANDQLLASIVGLPGGAYEVTWYSRQTGNWALYQRQFDASGPVTNEARITAWGGAWGPAWAAQSVALEGGGYVTVWQSNDGSGNVNDIYLQRFTDAGALIGTPVRANSYRIGEQTSPTVAATADGGFVVGWQSAGQDGSGLGVYAQRFDPNGARVGNEFRLSNGTAGDQSIPSFAPTPDGGFITTWGGATATVKLFNASTVNPETALPAGLGGSRIAALTEDRYAVVYQDTDAIAVQVLNANGQPLGLPLAISGAGPHPWAPSITGLRDGGFVITWTNDTTSTAIDTLAQRFDANGVAQGGVVRVNSYLPDGQGASIVSALDDGGYVIAWHSLHQDGSSFGVYGQRYDAVGQPAGGEFRINQTTVDDQLLASVVGLSGGTYQVTWYSRQTGNWELYQRQFDASGPVTNEARITAWGGTWGPAWAAQSVALEGGGYVTVWQSNDGSGNVNDIYLQRFTDAGTLIGTPVRANSYRIGEQTSPTVAATPDGGFVVGWQSAGQDGSGLGVYAQRFDPNGALICNEFRLSNGTAGDQSIPSFAPTPDGGFITTWGGATATVKLFSGSPAGPVIEAIHGILATGDTCSAEALVRPGHVNGAQWDGAGLQQQSAYQFIDLTGATGSGRFMVNGMEQQAGSVFTISAQDLSNVHWVSGNGAGVDSYRVRAFDGQNWSTWEDGTMRTVSPSTNLTAGPETTLPAGLGGSRIAALAGDRYAVVYQDTDAIAVQVLNANGQPLGLPLAISGAGPHPWAPSITGLRDGGFVITWTNDTTSTAIDTLAQRFDADGVAQGGIVRVNSYLPDGQGASVVSALDDGGYVIAWHSLNQDGSSFGVYGQRYDAVGQPAGGEFRINQTTANDQLLASVVGLSGGAYEVTWYSRQTGNWALYQRQFDASGPVTNEARITAWGGTWGPAWAAQSVALEGGGYVTVWQSNDGSGNVNDIYLQRFTDAGTLIGTPVRANSYRIGEQTSPTVAATADGGFVVGWQSAGQDGSGLGVYAQRFDPNGARVGNEFRLSNGTAGDQSIPSFAPTPDGGFITTWGGATATVKLYQGVSTSGTVQGTPGNDVLVSTSAQEVFTGGAGNDTFLFLTPSLGGDAILDFQSGQDWIKVAGAAFGGLPAGLLAAERFALNTPADADDRFFFNTDTGILFYDPDGSGMMAATAIVMLNVRILAATDIWVV